MDGEVKESLGSRFFKSIARFSGGRELSSEEIEFVREHARHSRSRGSLNDQMAREIALGLEDKSRPYYETLVRGALLLAQLGKGRIEEDRTEGDKTARKRKARRRAVRAATVASLGALVACTAEKPVSVEEIMLAETPPAMTTERPIWIDWMDEAADWGEELDLVGIDLIQPEVQRNEDYPGRALHREVQNEEDPELRYSELVTNLSVYDLSRAENLNELNQLLQEEIYTRIESRSRENIREMEILVNRSTIEAFRQEGISLFGWLVRHFGFQNSLLAEKGLDLRLIPSRMVIVSDEVGNAAADIDNDEGLAFFLGWGPYYWKGINRWIITGDPRLSSRYQEEQDINVDLLHEWGHYGLFLWDLYNYHENGGQVVRIRSSAGQEIPLLIPPYTFPLCWLMNTGEQSRLKTILSPFSVAALRQIEERGISSWAEALTFWRNEFLNISPESRARFVDQDGAPLRGRIHLFTAEYDPEEKTRYFPHHSTRRWRPVPMSFVLDERGSIRMPSDILRSYARYADGNEIVGLGQNFTFVIETEEGEILATSTSPLPWILATWNASPGEEVEVVFTPIPPSFPE